MIASPVRFGLGAAAVILPLAALSRAGAALGLWQAMLVILLIGFPVWLTLSYLSAIRKAHATAILRRPVWWGVFLSGHGLRMALAIVPATLAGLGMVSAILSQGLWSVIWLVPAAILVGGSAALTRSWAGRNFRPFALGAGLVYRATLTAAVILTAAAVIWTIRPAAPDSLTALIDAPSGYLGSSAAVALIADWMAFLSGAQALAERAATGQGLPFAIILVWRAIGAFGYQFALALAMAAPLLLTGESRRILVPTDSDIPGPVPPLTAAVASAVAVILSVLMIQILARIELAAEIVAAAETESPSLLAPDITTADPILATEPDALPAQRSTSPLSPSGLIRRVESEIIGNLQCPPGTIAAIEAMDAEFRAILATQRDTLNAAIGTGFDAVRANVPGFLDWYYSLSAEYLRTANLLIGNGVGYLEDQFQSHIDANAPLAGVEAALAALSGNQLLADVHRDNRLAQLASCAVALPQDDARIIATDTRPASLLTTDLHIEAISFETRLTAAGIGGVAGLAAGVIMAKIGAKAVASSLFKMAAAALAKIAGSKAISLGGGILLGGGAGAAGGSVVPGAGTTAGAIAGGIIGGLAVMFGVDFALLKLDEEISRADFQTDIIANIDAAEAELRGQLGLTGP